MYFVSPSLTSTFSQIIIITITFNKKKNQKKVNNHNITNNNKNHNNNNNNTSHNKLFINIKNTKHWLDAVDEGNFSTLFH